MIVRLKFLINLDTIRDEILVKNPPSARLKEVGPGSYMHDDKMMSF